MRFIGNVVTNLVSSKWIKKQNEENWDCGWALLTAPKFQGNPAIYCLLLVLSLNCKWMSVLRFSHENTWPWIKTEKIYIKTAFFSILRRFSVLDAKMKGISTTHLYCCYVAALWSFFVTAMYSWRAYLLRFGSKNNDFRQFELNLTQKFIPMNYPRAIQSLFVSFIQCRISWWCHVKQFNCCFEIVN